MSSLANFVKRFEKIYFTNGEDSKEKWMIMTASFRRAFKKDLKLSYFTEVKASSKYFYISGHMKHKNGTWIYFSTPDVRYEATGKRWYDDILYHKAKDENDYSGGINHYCKLAELLSKANELARNEKAE